MGPRNSQVGQVSFQSLRKQNGVNILLIVHHLTCCQPLRSHYCENQTCKLWKETWPTWEFLGPIVHGPMLAFLPMSRVLPLFHCSLSFHKWGALLNWSGWVWGPWDLRISVDRPPSDLLPTASVPLLWEPKVCFHLYLQKNSKMTIIIIIQLPFKNFRLHNQESRLWCRQGSHLSVERVPAASWLGTRFQVSHGYFMKYYMMGLLQMPNIMSSIEADRLICWKLDILSH